MMWLAGPIVCVRLCELCSAASPDTFDYFDTLSPRALIKAFGPGRCLGKMRCKRFTLTQRIERSKKRNLPSLMLAKSPGTGCGALKEEKGCGKIPPFPLCSRGASANLFQILFFLKRKVHSPICHAAAHSSLKRCRMHIAPHIMPYATTTL